MSRPCLLLVLIAGLLATPTDLPAQRIKLSMKLSELEKAAVADSNDAVAHYNLALGLWGKKRLDEAEQSLKTALELDPRFAPAHLALAFIPYARNDDLWEEVPEEWEDEIEESDRNYQRAFMIDPLVELRIVGAVVPAKSVLWTHDEVLSRLYDEWIQGFDDFRDGKYSAAYFRFDRMIDNLDGDKHPDRVPTSIFWFQCLTAAHLERYDEAIELAQYLLDQSKEEEEGDHLVHLPLQTNEYRYVLAFLHQKAGLREAAAKLYQETLENDFGLYMAHVRLAEIHEAHQSWTPAITERRLAVEANPEDFSLRLDLGITQAKGGRVDDAMLEFEQAAVMQPRDPRPHYFMGLLHQMKNAQEEARGSLTEFLALAPARFAPQIRDAQNRLETLR